MFVLTKLLSFLPMGNVLRGTSGKFILIAGAVVGLLFIVWQWKDNIREAVFNEIYAEQAQAALEDKERQLETVREISEKNRELQNQLAQKNRQLEEKFDEARRNVSNVSEEEDDDVSKVLRDTIKFVSDSDLSSFEDETEGNTTENRKPLDTDNPWIQEWQEKEKSGD